MPSVCWTSAKASGIAVSCLDRLALRLPMQEAMLEAIWSRGAGVYEVASGEVPRDDPDDPYRTFLRQFVDAAAQVERALIAKRMADGRRRAVRQGRIIGPAPSFGWINDPDDPGRPLPDPATFSVAKTAVEQLDGGATLKEVAGYLEGATGRRWHPAQVGRLRDRHRRYTPGGEPPGSPLLASPAPPGVPLQSRDTALAGDPLREGGPPQRRLT